MRPTRRTIPWLALALTLAATAAVAQSGQQVAQVNFGEVFPPGTYGNLNPAAGQPATVDLASSLGKKPVILYYWIPGHTRSEAMFQEIEKVLAGSSGVALYGVATERPGVEAAKIKERVAKMGIRAPVLNDVGFKLGQMLFVKSVPNVSIIDAEGRLRMSNGASLTQVIEYNLTVEDALRRAAGGKTIGTYGQLPRYYPVNEMVGKPCPSFNAPRVDNGVVQRSATLFKPDKVNVLLFWSVDCPHCRKTLPEINAWLKQNGDGMNVISAALVKNQAMKTKTKEFCRFNGFVFPTLLDENRALSDLFLVTATPTLLFIDADGKIESVLTSGTDDFKKTFEEKIRSLRQGP